MSIKIPEKKMESKIISKEMQTEMLNKAFQSCFNTPDGRAVLTFLVAHSRVFANGLKIVSNLKSTYKVSDDYYLAQSDYGKEILSHLSKDQIAEMVSLIITDEKKEKRFE